MLREDIQAAAGDVMSLASRFPVVDLDALLKSGWDRETALAAVEQAQRRGVLVPREGRRGSYASTTYGGEDDT